MTNFPIQIDATQLVYRGFQIPGITDHFINSQIAQTLSLPSGTYQFQVGSGSADIADFKFSVTAQGTVDYDASFDAFLTGRGSSRLTIVGFQVTLDARYLSGSGVSLVVFDPEFITYKTCRMVPASFYSVQQGSGVVASFFFKLGLDGTFSYNLAYDVGSGVNSGGFLAGKGTSTLQFLGYPLLVDARAAGGDSITITTIWNMPVSSTSVEFADLLPAPFFAIQVNTVQTKAIFSIDVEGRIHFDSSLDPFLERQTFNGLTLLKVKGPLPT